MNFVSRRTLLNRKAYATTETGTFETNYVFPVRNRFSELSGNLAGTEVLHQAKQNNVSNTLLKKMESVNP